MREPPELPVTVDGEGHEHQREDRRAGDEEQPCLAFGHGVPEVPRVLVLTAVRLNESVACMPATPEPARHECVNNSPRRSTPRR